MVEAEKAAVWGIRAVLDFSLSFQSAAQLAACRQLGGRTELRARDERVGAARSFPQQSAASKGSVQGALAGPGTHP